MNRFQKKLRPSNIYLHGYVPSFQAVTYYVVYIYRSNLRKTSSPV